MNRWLATAAILCAACALFVVVYVWVRALVGYSPETDAAALGTGMTLVLAAIAAAAVGAAKS